MILFCESLYVQLANTQCQSVVFSGEKLSVVYISQMKYTACCNQHILGGNTAFSLQFEYSGTDTVVSITNADYNGCANLFHTLVTEPSQTWPVTISTYTSY